jgi:hypothetical protein
LQHCMRGVQSIFPSRAPRRLLPDFKAAANCQLDSKMSAYSVLPLDIIPKRPGMSVECNCITPIRDTIKVESVRLRPKVIKSLRWEMCIAPLNSHGTKEVWAFHGWVFRYSISYFGLSELVYILVEGAQRWPVIRQAGASSPNLYVVEFRHLKFYDPDFLRTHNNPYRQQCSQN